MNLNFWSHDETKGNHEYSETGELINTVALQFPSHTVNNPFSLKANKNEKKKTWIANTHVLSARIKSYLINIIDQNQIVI